MRKPTRAARKAERGRSPHPRRTGALKEPTKKASENPSTERAHTRSGKTKNGGSQGIVVSQIGHLSRNGDVGICVQGQVVEAIGNNN